MLWGSRFDRPPDELFARFNNSFHFDWRFAAADIRGSIAYAHALARAGLITQDEAHALEGGLVQVAAEFAGQRFAAEPSDEDIHTAVERRLHSLVGPVAGKLHTGRSRNDQVTTDTRLFLLDALTRAQAHLVTLQRALVERAQEHFETVMPGYTHLRQAQPITLAHYLLSFFWMFQRDRARLHDLRPRVAVLPLGSGALAGNPFGLDREFLARELEFESISENSLDAVSDRDYIVEFLSAAALIQTHLSRLAEDIILYSSSEFGFFGIADAYSTGSSLMPQKKNPDSLELVRGKTGRVVGSLTSLLVTLKGIPSTYDKDLQEDKEPLFDTLDTLDMTLPITAGVVRTLSINPARMAAALDTALLATDLAEYLVGKGMPFRQAHHVVGAAVRTAQARGVGIEALGLDELQALASEFGSDVGDVFDFARSVARRSSYGGTAPAAVREQLAHATALLE